MDTPWRVPCPAPASPRASNTHPLLTIQDFCVAILFGYLLARLINPLVDSLLANSPIKLFRTRLPIPAVRTIHPDSTDRSLIPEDENKERSSSAHASPTNFYPNIIYSKVLLHTLIFSDAYLISRLINSSFPHSVFAKSRLLTYTCLIIFTRLLANYVRSFIPEPDDINEDRTIHLNLITANLDRLLAKDEDNFTNSVVT